MLFLQQRVRDIKTFLFPLWNCVSFWIDHQVNNNLKSQKLISAPFDTKNIFFGIIPHAVNNNVLIKYILYLPF